MLLGKSLPMPPMQVGGDPDEAMTLPMLLGNQSIRMATDQGEAKAQVFGGIYAEGEVQKTLKDGT